MPIKELELPQDAFSTVQAGEILRVFMTDQKQMELVLIPAFDTPETWGRLFADIAHHVARAYGDLGVSQHVTLESIRDMFNEEMGKPPAVSDTWSVPR